MRVETSEPEAIAKSVAPLAGGDGVSARPLGGGGACALDGRSGHRDGFRGRLERDDELLTLADAALGDCHSEYDALP